LQKQKMKLLLPDFGQTGPEPPTPEKLRGVKREKGVDKPGTLANAPGPSKTRNRFVLACKEWGTGDLRDGTVNSAERPP